MSKFVDLTGKRFGRLVVKKHNGTVNSKSTWVCACDCGKTNVVSTSYHLKSGNTQSCGCYRKDQLFKANTKHGKAKTETYKIWLGIKKRCYNQNDSVYKYYGGRGITVCDRWSDYSLFLFDMGERPLGHWIDRINSNGNYEPSNCRWATPKTQQNNRRNNHLLTYNGHTHTMQEWAELLHISRGKIKDRIIKLNWTTEKALTTP